MQKKGGLGRGLDALIPQNFANDEASSVYAINEISLEGIETNPYQPRTDFDEQSMQELADSIRAQGIIQPITVRLLSAGRFQLIAGERRTIAARRAGLSHIPAYIRQADDEQMLEFALIENIQRQDLNPLETAIAYKRLMDECTLTIEQVGDKVGKNRATVNNYMRLLKLPPEVQKGLRQGAVSMGHARALLGVDDKVLQSTLYKDIVDKGLSVRQVEEAVRNLTQEKKAAPAEKPAAENPAYAHQVRRLQDDLAVRYNTRVRIQTTGEGGGEVKFSFFSQEDLNRLLELFQ